MSGNLSAAWAALGRSSGNLCGIGPQQRQLVRHCRQRQLGGILCGIVGSGSLGGLGRSSGNLGDIAGSGNLSGSVGSGSDITV